MHILSVCMCYVFMNVAEFSPSSDGNYPSSGGSPLPNKAQSPQNNFGNVCVCVMELQYVCLCVQSFNMIMY